MVFVFWGEIAPPPPRADQTPCLRTLRGVKQLPTPTKPPPRAASPFRNWLRFRSSAFLQARRTAERGLGIGVSRPASAGRSGDVVLEDGQQVLADDGSLPRRVLRCKWQVGTYWSGEEPLVFACRGRGFRVGCAACQEPVGEPAKSRRAPYRRHLAGRDFLGSSHSAGRRDAGGTSSPTGS